MSLIKITNLTKYYGANLILQNINYQINSNEKIGIVGLNGTGKTTLLKIITKEVGFDSGNIDLMKDIKIGYLSQQIDLESEKSLYETMVDSLTEINSLKKEMTDIEQKLSQHTKNSTTLTERYGELQHRYEESGGYKVDYIINNVLTGLGFKKSDWDKKISILSGGQKSRAMLSRLLLEKPDLILLDEPTNHLDIDAVSWLEEYLINYDKSILIVSHDRYFLDRVVNKIVEIENSDIASYTGNYSNYIKEKSERVALQQKNYNLQKATILEKQEFIRRNIAGQKTKQAKSRIKELAKMEIVKKPVLTKKITLNFTTQKRGGNNVLTIEGLSKSYGELKLFEDFNLNIEKGNRIGIIGPNGSGKTTLLKMLIGEESYQGIVKIGSNIEIGYYAQHLNDSNEENSIIDEVWQIKPSLTEGEMRNYLGGFMFYDDEVFMKIKYLSGGEKARVSLAKIILSEANFLILDEPTNHLDIFARMALEDSLQNYSGTILSVSHDRYFLNKIADKILLLEGGKHTIYNGNYDYYQQKRTEERASVSNDKGGKEEYLKNKQEKNRQKIKLRSIADIEKDISEIEESIIKLEKDLDKEENYLDYRKAETINSHINDKNEFLKKLYEEWEYTIEQKNSK